MSIAAQITESRHCPVGCSNRSRVDRQGPIKLAQYRWLGTSQLFIRGGLHVRYRRENVFAWIESMPAGGPPVASCIHNMPTNMKAGGANTGFIITNVIRLNRGALITRFDINVRSGLVITRSSLTQNSGGRCVAISSPEWEDRQGEKKFRPNFTDRATHDAFNEAVIPVVDAASQVVCESIA
jgi:hypothetical protein